MINIVSNGSEKNEQGSVKLKWLNLHFRTSLWAIGFNLFFESIMFFLLNNLGQINTTPERYLYKYAVVPLILNLITVLVNYIVIHSRLVPFKVKMYVVSLLYVEICSIIFTIHSVYNALYLIFTVPVVLTIIYSDYLLTTVTAVLSIAAKVFSDIFFFYDADKASVLENGLGVSDFIISILILFVVFIICLVVIRFDKERNLESVRKEIERYHLQQMLKTDELTQINNRMALNLTFQEIENDKSDKQYIFVMIDVDNFKILNDTLGHSAGDSCLEKFGNLLETISLSNGNATSYRYGGDEFCIIIENETVERVCAMCSEIKARFESLVQANFKNIPLSLSFGIARYNKTLTTKQVLKNTDFALYQSKSIKNKITVFS